MDCPDTDEDEFELMHAQELEMMREMEEEFEPPDDVPVTPKFKRSLDFNSPQRKDLGNCNSKKRIGVSSENLAITSDPGPSTSSSSLLSGCYPLESNSAPTFEELFGDITDLELNEHSNKRLKLDFELSADERKEILIKKILDQRNQSITHNRKIASNISEFREKNINDSVSKKVPKWPFMPLTDTNNQRYYFRLRSKDFMDNKAKEKYYNVDNTNLLDVSFEELKQMALKEVLNKEERKLNSNLQKENVSIHEVEQELWVERYKPKTYCQLLSDESTNRALLYWLKQWDKIVFSREPPGQRLQNGHNNQQWQQTNNFKQTNQKTEWKSKNGNTDLVFQLDQFGRPYFKIAMLCGPPGLGKTTLAHMLARQAGYSVVEMNASDDRSIQAFRTQLEAATRMKSVMAADPKPNCLIVDEIDGAPQPSVDFLVKFASDKIESKGRKVNNKKGNKGLLKRPIICICNDVFVPALRSLRQVAYTLNVPHTSPARLGERLMEITREERILTDLGTMMALSEKTNNDIRSCLSFLHCLKADENRVTLTQVHSANIGTKDTQQGLFPVWQTIFHYKLNKSCNIPAMGMKRQNDSSTSSFSEVGFKLRLDNVRRTVQSFGDYDRLTMGVFENYLRIKSIDSSMNSIAEATRWFCFQDIISTYIQSSQIYALYPYLVFPFLVWHLLFSTINWPKLIYPHTPYEVNSRRQRISQILQFTLLGMPAQVQAYQDRKKLMLDIIPYLIELIVPTIRPVSIQLYSDKEKDEVRRVTCAMVDYNLSYSQERTQEGSYHYKLDPDIEEIGLFGEHERSRIFSYTGKQMVSREVEAEKIRRLSLKANTVAPVQIGVDIIVANSEQDKTKQAKAVKSGDKSPSVVLPNHLQKLTPKALKKPTNVHQKDFFGRVISITLEKETTKAKTDDIVKSDVWYHFKEGYNNAVKRSVLMSELY